MASVANLAPSTTPGYLPVFDSKLALTNSPLYRFSSNILGFNSTLPFLWYSGNNIGIGDGFNYTQSGNHNLMIGTSVASHLTSGSQNVLLGGSPGNALTTGNDNVSIGSSSLRDDLVGSKNIAIGTGALQHTLDSGNIGIGYSAGVTSTNGTNNIFIGYNANTSSSSASNEVSIGYAAIGHGNDSVTLGNTGVNDLWLGTNHVFPASGGVVINPTLNFVPYKSGSSSFGDSWWYYTANGMGTDTNVFFGPGTTNVIGRSANDAFYSNSVTAGSGAVKWIVNNGSGNQARLVVRSNGDAGIEASTGFLWLPSLTVSGTIIPSGDDIYDLGSSSTSGAYRDLFLKGKLYVESLNDGAGNYSRLAVSQSSTNVPIVFDMQTAGTAGYARGYSFQTNGVEFLRYDQFGLHSKHRYESSGFIDLTDATTNKLFEITLEAGEYCGGLLDVTFLSTDGTDYKVHNSGGVSFSFVNKAGTITGSITEALQLETHVETAGNAMTDSFSHSQDGSNKVAVLTTPGKGTVITPTTYRARWTLNSINGNGALTITP